jgi:hypothetical protein
MHAPPPPPPLPSPLECEECCRFGHIPTHTVKRPRYLNLSFTPVHPNTTCTAHPHTTHKHAQTHTLMLTCMHSHTHAHKAPMGLSTTTFFAPPSADDTATTGPRFSESPSRAASHTAHCATCGGVLSAADTNVTSPSGALVHASCARPNIPPDIPLHRRSARGGDDSFEDLLDQLNAAREALRPATAVPRQDEFATSSAGPSSSGGTSHTTNDAGGRSGDGRSRDTREGDVVQRSDASSQAAAAANRTLAKAAERAAASHSAPAASTTTAGDNDGVAPSNAAAAAAAEASATAAAAAAAAAAVAAAAAASAECHRLGRRCHGNGHFAKAAAHWDRAVGIDRTDADA